MTIVKIVLAFFALIALIVGGVWLAQGVGALQGSRMTGDMNWAYSGGSLALVGAALMFWTVRSAGVGRGFVGLLGLMLVLVGAIWLMQGMNILGGSTMTGDVNLTYRGGGAIAVGAALAFVMARKSGAVRSIFGAFGAILLLLGGVWVLQGLNVLPGSYMTGDINWAYRGGVLAAAGAAFLFWSVRSSKS